MGPDLRVAGWQVAFLEAVRSTLAALVCVVGEQAASPWLHFQLGACFRALGRERPVVPVLLDVAPESLSATPIGLFQAVRPVREDFARLVRDLAQALAPTEGGARAAERFEPGWEALLERLELVPGVALRAFQVVLVLPDVVMPVPNSTPSADEEWASVVRRMTAIQRLPGMSIPPFSSSELECLDLAREEWMRAPRLLSRIPTRNIALVHRAVRERYQGNAKAVAKVTKARLHAPTGVS
jgi:hypothetical protein